MQTPDLPRPNWTRVHLVYFVLAAFDLAAVGTGLWLSNTTQKNFARSTASVDGTNFLYDRAAVLQRSAAQLSEPIYELQYHRDPRKAETALNKAAGSFRETVSEEGFRKDLTRHFGGAMPSELEDGGEVEAVYASILHVPQQVMESYERSEANVRSLGETITGQLRKAITEFRQGRPESAAIAVGRASRSIAELQRSIAEQSQLADNYARIVVANSRASLDNSHRMQYGIGAFILAMVGLVMFYAHAMGRLLVAKFKEIEAARDSSQQYASRLAIVNDDVSKLNIQLSENMKRLSLAQDKIFKKGRMEQLGHLTATVAHELRNPLGAVRTSAFLLERNIKGKNTGLEPQIHRISNGIVRCDDIITQLLDFSRSAAAHVEPADLDDWLQKLVEDEVQRLPAAVEVELAPGLSGQIVEFDGARLCRAVINLLSNASEALVGKGDDPGKFATPNPKIVIATRLAARGAEISVSDNGPGINPEDFTKILEPLYTTKNFGTGLGLPAVKRITEQHGGGLDMASAPGQGSSFTIWIPLTQAAVQAA
jgi:signal transduction histidine kinase